MSIEHRDMFDWRIEYAPVSINADFEPAELIAV